MKNCFLLATALMMIACSQPDPYDNVRALRRQYELNIDLTINDTGEATYELRARNLSGKEELHEITTLVRILDKDQKPLWSKKVELEVLGTGPYATASQQFKDQVGVLDYEYFDVQLAPDDKDSDFKSYREFMRVSP